MNKLYIKHTHSSLSSTVSNINHLDVYFFMDKTIILKLLVQIYVVVYLFVRFLLVGPILWSRISLALGLYHIYSITKLTLLGMISRKGYLVRVLREIKKINTWITIGFSKYELWEYYHRKKTQRYTLSDIFRYSLLLLFTFS